MHPYRCPWVHSAHTDGYFDTVRSLHDIEMMLAGFEPEPAHA
ncbi:MAG TPA: hypothetical protein VE132_06695 [Micromonosporaceae bacterium]|jgi:hypothetical protein|nr:hypothetical protein [Micromonosporaceae bacterium]